MHTINDLLILLTEGLSWGSYLTLFIIATLEAIPIFGFFVPGQVVAVGSGLLAKIGSLNISTIFIVLSFGAVVGDLIGYFLGIHYGENFILKYKKYFFLKEENFQKTKNLILTHTGKTIILGRFNSITRAFTPFAAGFTKIPLSKFIFFDILGGIIWAVSFPMLGYFLGNNYQLIADYFGEFFAIALIFGALIVYAYKQINRKKRIFYRRHLYILLINLFSLYLLFKMLENFVDQDLLVNFDYWFNLKLSLLRNTLLNQIMIFITHLADTITLTLGGLILSSFFVLKKKWRYFLILVLSFLGGKLSEIVIKNILVRDRPDNAIIETTYYSLPSGHATMALIFFTILIYFIKNHLRNKTLKYTLITLCFSTILAIGFSRIYLGAHWFSDVIAGFALGSFCLTLTILILEFITTIFKEKIGEIKKYLNKKITF
jgi:undecaprenyl-diphosphatase